MTITVEFEEAADVAKVSALPMSHLSLELGHLYQEDFQQEGRVLALARQVAPWAQAAREAFVARAGGKGKPRFSTCFMIDDYFSRFTASPAELIGTIVETYAQAGLTIDYIAREAACARVGELRIARNVAVQIVDEPLPGVDGTTRPPARTTGWLTNGQRSTWIPRDSGLPIPVAAAMTTPKFAPPEENARHRHSVFIDVQMWGQAENRDEQEWDFVRLDEKSDGPASFDDEDRPGFKWSCPFLAAVWQLMRLGLLRQDNGAAIVEPVPYAKADLSSWDRCPAVVQLTERPQAFTAYCTFSALNTQFLGIEHAVRTILNQVNVQKEVEQQVRDRIQAEGLHLPTDKIVDRIDYAFLAPPHL